MDNSEKHMTEWKSTQVPTKNSLPLGGQKEKA